MDIGNLNRIRRHIDGRPTIVESIEEECLFDNGFFSNIIIDQKFIEELLSTIKEDKLPKNLISLLTYINAKIINYFYSSSIENKDRIKVYFDFAVKDDEGEVIGTRLSSLKGKNVAMCSEKSIATFIILSYLFKKGKLSRKPSLVGSVLNNENHVFVIMDREQDEYPTRHLLYDPENFTQIEDTNGIRSNLVGVYSLTDEQHHNILNGVECNPTSLFVLLQPEWTDVSGKRIYGSITLDKSI